MLPIHKILHPTDFSDSAKPAFELACALARDYRATLVLVHVVPPTHVFAPDGIAVPFPIQDEYDAQATLARMHPADPEVTVEYHVRDGDPIAQILKIATDDAIDVIVMGTHGASGLTRLLVGSVAESVMRKAPCPVLTVRGQFRLSPDRASVQANEEAPH
jgi:nucleotide-binding universal stress UspA family protein